MATDGDHIGNTKGDYTSVSIDDEDEMLANSITKMLGTVSRLSAKCCIFRVPEVLRRLNEKLYEPDVVAIGPYHRKKKSLQPMEAVKRRYLHDLLSRTKISMLSLIKGIKELETRARECYQEPIDVDDKKNEFMEMMIIDGCFLIEFFQKVADSNLRSEDDPIFNMDCIMEYLRHDLLLLENQLPWFIIQTLFNLTEPNDQILTLVLTFFPFICRYGARLPLDKENLHILDLIRDVLVFSYSDTDQTKSTSSEKSYLKIPCVTRLSHGTDQTESTSSDEPNRMTPCVSRLLHGTDQTESTRSDKPNLKIPCVTRLLEAGVKFKKGSRGSITNIKFKDGIFEIPPFLIDEKTEPMFRNLIAFEQCYHDRDHKITSYAFLMDNLINTDKDVEYLAEKEIIDNWLSDGEASQFFNQLYNDASLIGFDDEELFKSVNKYYRTKWHRWRAILMGQYFTTPWTIISLIAGVILLVLTFLQTLYSIKQSYSSDDNQNPANSTRLR